MKLEDCLKIHADSQPDKVAVIYKDESLSYRDLYQRVLAKTNDLLAIGCLQGTAFCFKNTQDIEFLITYFAVHLLGGIAVPLEKEIADDKFNYIQDEYYDFRPSEDVADILYTTGTTGKSKGVMISYEAIMADAENLLHGHGYTDETVFVICGPLNHIGSLSKIYPTILAGGTLIILEGFKDFDSFFSALDYPSKKIATFLVPASIRMLLLLAKSKIAGYKDKIDFIETGAAPMPHSDKEKLCELLPNTRLYNTYASTETGIISTYNFNDGICKPGCLGKPLKNSMFFLTEDGHVACKGKTIMSGYALDETKTKQVLHDNTIFTADIGEIDEDGMLHLIGRNDDVINVGGYKISPIEVEDVALSFPMIKDCICISVPSSITGEALKLLFVEETVDTVKTKELARFLDSRLERYKVPQFYEKVGSIKRTFNGKIDRNYYR